MRKIELIKRETIYVNSKGVINAFALDESYLDEIAMWPSGIKIIVKKENEKYKITPVDWVKNSVFAAISF